ncbi:hypothetical protein M9H77_05913 [Catharanthus roseus]|uniref:Uncharacterized protein n=1 Tax=Catharanthus roseus TaxID=4058 RepID=A0ACC0BQL7_CATRO|nr:hypothetical protein M9H77_05913 [Catharanthus roseus]
MTVNFTKISSVFAPVNSNSISDLRFHYRNATVTSLDSVHPFSFPFGVGQFSTFTFRFRHLKLPTIRRKLASPTASLPMFSQNQVMGDVVATALTGGIALSALRFWEETAKRGLFDQKLNRKLVHISIGLIFMLCWPMFSSGHRGAILAATIPAVNIIKMLLIGLGLWKDDATVKSMSRFGDHRELLKGPLYYATTITVACAVYWRSSPVSIAMICNLCAGDGMADIVGRRLGHQKLPYNSNKSIIGSISMAIAGFLASLGYMHYFFTFGYIEESWDMVMGFLAVSLAAALVESHPLSTEIDDNLTVPLASLLVASYLF